MGKKKGKKVVKNDMSDMLDDLADEMLNDISPPPAPVVAKKTTSKKRPETAHGGRSSMAHSRRQPNANPGMDMNAMMAQMMPMMNQMMGGNAGMMPPPQQRQTVVTPKAAFEKLKGNTKEFVKMYEKDMEMVKKMKKQQPFSRAYKQKTSEKSVDDAIAKMEPGNDVVLSRSVLTSQRILVILLRNAVRQSGASINNEKWKAMDDYQLGKSLENAGVTNIFATKSVPKMVQSRVCKDDDYDENRFTCTAKVLKAL